MEEEWREGVSQERQTTTLEKEDYRKKNTERCGVVEREVSILD